MARSLSLWGTILLMTVVLTSCGGKVDLSDASLQVFLLAPEGGNRVVDQQYIVLVVATDAAGEPLDGLEVSAELFDAQGNSHGRFACQAVSEERGRYRSASFVPCPQEGSAIGDCAPGTWRVVATATKGQSSLEASAEVQIEASLGQQALQQHGFYLAIPPDWRVLTQRNAADAGLLLLDPLPQQEDRGLLEVRYANGESEVTKEALQAFVSDYHPQGYTSGQALVRQTLAIDIQGNPGFLLRGDLLVRQGNTDYNFFLQAYRFYCQVADRTYTILALSTSEATLSKMAAAIDALQCAGKAP